MRARTFARPFLATLLVCAASACMTRGMNLPFGDRVLAELYLTGMFVGARLLPSSLDAPEGFEVEVVRELGERTAVGLDVAPDGDVYLAISERIGGVDAKGVSDNRWKPYWLLDDLAARTVDDRRAYIEKWAERGGDPLSWYTDDADSIVRLRDGDGDGALDEEREVFAVRDVLSGVGSSVLVDGDALWYTAIPDLFRLRDADGDGEFEQRDVVAHGFGVATSLSGHDLHGLTIGPDGRIYFSVGDRGYDVETREGRRLRPPIVVSRGAVFRMQPDGSELEVFATGLRNPQDLAFDDFGELFTGDNNGDGADEARLVHVVDGGDSGWAMPYQSMEGDYYHGPWEAERLWEVRHDGQPAWIVPPIGYIGRGPSGVAIDPGLGGLPEAFRGRLLVCDYQYATPRSGVRAYEIAREGAGFRLASEATAFPSLLPTDLAFGPDGWLYVTTFDQLGGATSRVVRYARPEHVADARVIELGALLREGFAARSDGELAALLGHADRRARLGAQRELAARGAAETLGGVARDGAAPLLASVHALWGLGQLGADGLERAGVRDLEFTRAADPELRAQALRVVGWARAAWLEGELLAALEDDSSPRAQRFAAEALGRLESAAATAPLLELARRNDERDVVLRHSAVVALARIGDLDTVMRSASDESFAVRLAVVLVLRRAEDARIARFLRDADPRIVAEAARAIYDLKIADALPALAELAAGPIPGDGDGQTSGAIHRRAIAANLELGGAENALALAAHAVADSHPRAMRALALDALAEFAKPSSREPVFGAYRELPERASSTVHAALDRLVPALLGSEFEARALEIALAYGRVPLPDEELLARVESWFESAAVKRASLGVLADRRSTLLGDAIAAARRSRDAALRADAIDALALVDADAAIDAIQSLDRRSSVLERQRATAALARLGTPRADGALRESLASLARGELEPALRLDVLEAARARGDALGDELRAVERALASDDPVEARAIALEGGDVERGRRVFEGAGDCVRCHGASGGGHGGRAGPPLAGIGRRRDRRYILESVITPGAEVVAGYGTVVVELASGERFSATLVESAPEEIAIERGGDEQRVPRSEIATLGAPVSGMPPMGLALSLVELRDLVAYVSSL